MTMATCTANGVAPLGTDIRSCRPHALIAGALALMAAGPAVMLLAMFHAGLQVQPVARVDRSAAPAPITAAPPGPAVAEDSRALLENLLTRAGLRPHFDVHRLSWGQARKVNALLPAAAVPPDAAKPFLLEVDSKEGRQALHCLAQAAYYEAGAAGPDAEAGVVQVVLNRVRHPDFPKSVCGVVYQGSARQTGCQFTFTCDGALKRPLDLAAWSQAEAVARRALGGSVAPTVGASTYYHADYVFPTWAPSLVKTATIGPHIFYRMSGEAGQAAALVGRYAGGELKVTRAVLRATDALTQRAGLKLASATKAERAKVGGRVHLQIAGNDDAKLNAAQTAAVSAPVEAAAPAPVASVDSTPAA